MWRKFWNGRNGRNVDVDTGFLWWRARYRRLLRGGMNRMEIKSFLVMNHLFRGWCLSRRGNSGSYRGHFQEVFRHRELLRSDQRAWTLPKLWDGEIRSASDWKWFRKALLSRLFVVDFWVKWTQLVGTLEKNPSICELEMARKTEAIECGTTLIWTVHLSDAFIFIGKSSQHCWAAEDINIK